MTEGVVIGGGVAGAATASWLARGGAAATVVDGDEPGQATAAGAGHALAPLVTTRSSDVDLAPFAP